MPKLENPSKEDLEVSLRELKEEYSLARLWA